MGVPVAYLLLILLDYSTVISRRADWDKILAQRLALLESDLRDLPAGAQG